MSSPDKLFIWILGVLFLPVLIGAAIAFAFASRNGDKVNTPIRDSNTPAVIFTSPESESDKLERLTKEAASLTRWISSNVDPLARCAASGTIDWEIYQLRLELFATILSESGQDAMDGRLDSYSTHEIERNIEGARQTIRELKTKCGIR